MWVLRDRPLTPVREELLVNEGPEADRAGPIFLITERIDAAAAFYELLR